ncbi:hypothetical protein OPV22_027827 [Ensete ventricosum]|uniref:Uncharacterized protein n=1 Tax=Ensete ventricosum TaxID=4639 RepID=A0AAV8Q8Q7_ENSVE|nr:hypothetical protein OPV22_027827 [Ensete ventricosum]
MPLLDARWQKEGLRKWRDSGSSSSSIEISAVEEDEDGGGLLHVSSTRMTSRHLRHEDNVRKDGLWWVGIDSMHAARPHAVWVVLLLREWLDLGSILNNEDRI